MEETDILNEEIKKIHKYTQNCNKCSNIICRTPILGDRYDKYRIMVILQNPLEADYKSQNWKYGYKRFKDYSLYKKDWIENVIRNATSETPLKILTFIYEMLFYQKARKGNKKELAERGLNYILYSNIIKIPSDGTLLPEWFKNCKLFGDKFTIDYEIEKFKPNIILVIGKGEKGTFGLMMKYLNIKKKTDIEYYYKDILTIPFYHVSRGWWDRACNRLEEKKKLIRRELGIKENLRE